ncbi:hypothetical protein [Bacillus sp. REN16]|uniref:hypothetical protein n=1 Tax=Bacillus sp. REN16 TaxID=2887296 RepID=UPI001E546188|nr:hypothetical protein [Bacillus sp. REN16]MCC3356545.1 hypothetical protein [Bacillus sp. REN16]
MGRLLNKSIFTEKGISLIEILISIVLLSIIVVSFLTMFVQSAKTNKISEDTLVATYLAQDTMECIYNSSKTSSFNSVKVKGDCTPKNDGYDTTISIVKEEDLYKVLVVVLNQSTGRKEAQMETLLSWKQ